MTTASMSGDPGPLTEGGSARTFSSLLEQNAEAGPSRSSVDDVRRRPHSLSISSVHFADMPHRKSDASLRHQALRASENISAAAAAESSGRSPRSSQPMRHASSFSHPSPTMASPRGLVRSPVSQQATSSPGAAALGTTEGSPKGSGRRSSQERRVRSEGGRPSRQNSLIANGIRPSAVTGGYESSSDDDAPATTGQRPPVEAVGPVKPARTTYEFPRFQPSQSFSGSRGLHGLGIADFTRKRSLSLMTPMEGGSLSPTSRSGSDASGTKSRTRSRAGSIGLLPLRPDGGSRRGSRDLLRPSNLRASPLSASGPSFPSLPSSRLPSSRSAQIPTEKADIFTSPGQNGHQEVPQDGDSHLDAPSPYSTDADPKGKRRDKASAARNGLVASLGIATSRNANAALTPDQINELLTDSDVASALRLMSGGSAGSAALSTPRRADVVADQAQISRPFTPTNLQEPFIATAPVTTQSPEARAASRERKISVHSAADSHDPSSTLTSSPSRRSELDERLLRARKRRASSRVTLGGEPEGGHIPFTHHVTQPIESKSAVLEDSDEASVPPPTNKELELRPGSSFARTGESPESPAPSRGTASPKPNGGMPGKKFQSRGRLSALLGIKRRKSDASGDSKSEQPSRFKPSGDPHRSNGISDKTEAQKIAERQKEKEEREREAEMRHKEQERREAELAQGISAALVKRRYKALTQVAAHPRSERLAYQAGSHLQAFYNHVYDGLDNPPRMNPLAVLRWKHRTEEQNRLREQWEEKVSREISERVVQDKGRSPRSGFSERFSESSRSFQMDYQKPAKSGGLEYLRGASSSRPKGPAGPGKASGRWWSCTIEDVSAYKECKGVVDYFIPPREAISEQSRASQDRENGKTRLSGENAASPAAGPPASSDKASKKGGSEVWVESRDITVQKGHGVHSSVDGSFAEINGGALGRVESNTGSFAPLSRSTSVETSAGAEHAVMRKHFHHTHHRHHHSLGGQAALAHVIKAPFEKLSSVARRQRTMPYLEGDPSDSGHERATPSRRETIGGLHPSQSVLRRTAAAQSSFSPASGAVAATVAASGGVAAHAAIGGDRAGNPNGSVRSRATDKLFRRSIGHDGSGRASLTDEDTRQMSIPRGQHVRNGSQSHLPKLFLKGDRLTTKLQAIGAVPLDLIRVGIGHRLAGHDQKSPEYRQAELAVLEEELRRETAFRERMVEEGSRLRSAKEETVEQQLRDVEAVIYHDRKERLNDVRRRLDSVNNKIGSVDDMIRGSLNQMLLIKESSRRAADLQLEWPDFGPLQAKYFEAPIPADEHDHDPPNDPAKRAQGDGGMSDARTPILQQNLQDSPRSMTSASPARPAARRTHEQSRKAVALLANSTHGLPTWSRRRDLDAAGRELVDPVTRARRALENARERFKEMGVMRLRAQSQLEDLAAEVVLITDQSKQRKPWARDTLDEIHDLKRRVEHAAASLDQPLATRLRATYLDPITNLSARALGSVLKAIWNTVRLISAYFGICSFTNDMGSQTAAVIRILVTGVILLLALWYNGRNP